MLRQNVLDDLGRVIVLLDELLDETTALVIVVLTHHLRRLAQFIMLFFLLVLFVWFVFCRLRVLGHFLRGLVAIDLLGILLASFSIVQA